MISYFQCVTTHEKPSLAKEKKPILDYINEQKGNLAIFLSTLVQANLLTLFPFISDFPFLNFILCGEIGILGSMLLTDKIIIDLNPIKNSIETIKGTFGKEGKWENAGLNKFIKESNFFRDLNKSTYSSKEFFYKKILELSINHIGLNRYAVKKDLGFLRDLVNFQNICYQEMPVDYVENEDCQKICNLILSSSRAAIINNCFFEIYSKSIKKIVNALELELLNSLVFPEFFDIFSDTFTSSLPINLTSYIGPLSTLKNVASILGKYHKSFQKQSFLFHTLISGEKDYVDYFSYGLLQIFPHCSLTLLDLKNNEGGLFSSIISSAQESKMNLEFDNLSAEGYSAIGFVPSILRTIYCGQKYLAWSLTPNTLNFFVKDLSSFPKREFKNIESLVKFLYTNEKLQPFERVSKNSAIIGFSESNNVDEAIISRFAGFVSFENMSFGLFIQYCKKVWLENLMEFGKAAFPESHLDAIIYKIAGKIYQRPEKIQSAHYLIKRLFFISFKRPNLTFDEVIKYI